MCRSGQAEDTILTLACEVLKLDKCNIVVGYKGSKGAALALSRGEMDAMYVSDSSADKYIRSADLRPVVVFGRDKSTFVPQAPTIFSKAKFSKDDAWLIDYNGKLEALGRVLLTAPGVPTDRLKLLQDMTKAVLTDPAVVAEAKKRRRDIFYADAEKTKANVLGTIRDLTPAQKKRVVSLLKVKG